MSLSRPHRPALTDAVPGLGTAAPLAPGLWSRPFMEPVPFEEGEAGLSPQAEALLDELATALAWFSTSCTIEVAGHAWSEGSDDRQRTLSQERASAVRDALVQRGLPPRALRVRGYGAQRPVEAVNRAAQQAVRDSRRVELWLHQSVARTHLPCDNPGGDGCCRGC
jgi:OOP family OmpA-OmpF porin